MSELFALRELPHQPFVPRRHGKPLSIPTLWRWVGKGVRGVRLETTMVGGVRMTSRDAWERFLAQLNPTRLSAGVSPRRERRSDRVERELKAAGL